MAFNSFAFAVFMPTVYLLYWFVFQNNLRVQNLFLLSASYFFYAWWDWRFLGLIVFISSFAFYHSRYLAASDGMIKRKLLFYVGLLMNLGLLAYFKYYNFFIGSFVDFLSTFGVSVRLESLNILLPLGISFYIFHTLGYMFDVYRRKIDPCSDPIAFFTYIAFFPKLITGPIEKSTLLLPQFYTRRQFDPSQAADGLRQILWGLLKKMVIADRLGVKVDEIFANYSHLNASTLWIGIFYYTLQIYCDFSGYSDIAIGTGKLLGFSLSKNFLFPYFSRDIAEFWRRWHITLFQWFREYVYLPVVYWLSRKMPNSHYFGIKTENYLYLTGILVTFFLTGLWHGANWTFIVWGMINGLFFVPIMLRNKKKKRIANIASGKLVPGLRETLLMLVTFVSIMLAWVFFRSDSLGKAILYLEGMFQPTIFNIPESCDIKSLFPIIFCFLLVEWIQRGREHGLDIGFIRHRAFRWSIYYSIILIIILFGGQEQSFIYFQF